MGLSPWILDDGNYEDFHVGDVASFALECYPRSLAPSTQAGARAAHVEGGRYQVNAAVAYVEPDFTVLDFGVRAYTRHLRPASAWLAGELALGIDPYFYFERFSKNVQIPPLIYTWRIVRIIQEWAPLIMGKSPYGGKGWIWDLSRKVAADVPATDAWVHDPRLRPTHKPRQKTGVGFTLVGEKLEEPPSRMKRPRQASATP